MLKRKTVLKLSTESLNAMHSQTPDNSSWISVGMSACGIAAGAEKVFHFLSVEVKKRNIPIEVKKCGCIGMCYAEPLVEVKVEGLPVITYGQVSKEIALRILEEHVVAKMLLNDSIFSIRT
jgi:NADP-reducing hydrogenase subunit HndB